MNDAKTRAQRPVEPLKLIFKTERVYGERFETRYAMKAMAFEYIEVFFQP